MSVEIIVKAPHGTRLHDLIVGHLADAITPAAANVEVAEVVAASDLPRSPTLADAIAIGRAVEKKDAQNAYETFVTKSKGDVTVSIPVSKFPKMPGAEQQQPAGLMNDPAYEEAFNAELHQVFVEEYIKPKSESDGEFLQRLGTDAYLWTDEFLTRFRKSNYDESIVLGWFANAIEAGRSAGIAATLADNVRTGSGESVEPTDDPHPDAARQAQYEHLLYAANSASTAQWQSERLVLEHLRSCAATGDFNIGIRTVINGGFIVVSTSSGEDAVMASTATDLFSCSTPAELLSAIALICAFAEHG